MDRGGGRRFDPSHPRHPHHHAAHTVLHRTVGTVRIRELRQPLQATGGLGCVRRTGDRHRELFAIRICSDRDRARHRTLVVRRHHLCTATNRPRLRRLRHAPTRRICCHDRVRLPRRPRSPDRHPHIESS